MGGRQREQLSNLWSRRVRGRVGRFPRHQVIDQFSSSGAIPDRISPYGWGVARRQGVLGLSDLRRLDPLAQPDRFRRVVQGYRVLRESSLPLQSHDELLILCAQACGTPLADDMWSFESHSEEWQQETYRQWSTAIDGFRLEPYWNTFGRPSVSVVVATCRPHNLELWTTLVASQTQRPLQVVAALHGNSWSATHHDRLRAVLGPAGIDVVIVTVDESAVLGEVLQAGCDRADGDVIVKWDDDDLYSTGHVVDLLRARHYSGATLVGKACDFVYVQNADTTVRRIQTPRELFSPTLAGGTLAIGRHDLRSVGGWDALRRDEDMALIDKVRRQGGTSYRMVGYGYLMIRRSRPGAHTWSADDSVFLSARNPRRPGLDASWAMIDQPADVIARAARDVDDGLRN